MLATGVLLLIVSSYTPIPLQAVTGGTAAVMLVMDLMAVPLTIESGRTRAHEVMGRMPWDVAPFAVSMFIVVNVLDAVGVTPVLTQMSLQLVELGVLAACCIGMVVTVVCMNVFNNQPATIFLVSVILGGNGCVAKANPQAFSGLVVVLILGSNIAAAFTMKGALAGIMWDTILKSHGAAVAWQDFTRFGVRLMTLPMVVGTLLSVAVTFVLGVSLPSG